MFKNFGNLGQLASLASAVPKLMEKLPEIQEDHKNERVTGSSACEKVEVTLDGVGRMQGIKIDPELAGQEQEAAIIEASNVAAAKAKEMLGAKFKAIADEMGIDIPGIDSLTSLLGNS
ncbi:MAG: YbaB/EbfC family nucleoid-associated protein [Planctomycetota bacterium]